MLLSAPAGEAYLVIALVLNQGLYTAIPVLPRRAPDIK